MDDLDSRRLGGGGGANIFEIGLYGLNGIDFWAIFTGMIVYCVLIDRFQAFLDYLAEGSEAGERFLQRIYIELLMFGVVAVTLFIISTSVPDLDPHISTLLTFNDMWCSIGACTLIFLFGIISMLRYSYVRHWRHCDKLTSAQKSGSDSLLAKGNAEDDSSDEWHVERISTRLQDKFFARVFSILDQEQYDTLGSVFAKQHQVPEGFKFYVYLDEVLTRLCCDMMTIDWKALLVLVAFGVLSMVKRWLLDTDRRLGEASDDTDDSAVEDDHIFQYTLGMAVASLTLTLALLILLCYCNRTFRRMLEMVSDVSDSDSEAEVHSHGGRRIAEGWSKWTCWILQVIVLSNCFQFGYYILHTRYILEKHPDQVSWVCNPIYIGSFLFNFLFLVPMIIPRITLVDGFYVMDAEALDAVFVKAERLDDDYRYLYRLWKARGEPLFAFGDKPLLLKDFQMQLTILGMCPSMSRVKRMFQEFDKDGNGSIELIEVTRKMEELKRTHEYDAKMTGVGDADRGIGASASGEGASARAVSRQLAEIDQKVSSVDAKLNFIMTPRRSI